MGNLTVEGLMRSWKEDRPRAEEILAEHERHARECPCGGGVKGHRSGWRPYLQNPSAALDRRNGRPSETRGYFTNAIWQDHLSTTREAGRLVFETQPYLTVEDVETDPDIAWLRSQGWEIAISTDSPHFPGWTIMVRLTPPLKVKS